MKNLSILTLLALLILGCSKDNEPDVLIDPSDSDALSQVLIMPEGTQSVIGNPPEPTRTSQAPEVSNPVDKVTSSNGSTTPLNFRYSNIDGNISGCYVQVDGAGNYFTVPYDTNSGSSGDLQLPLGIPTNVDEGEFCISFSIYDDNGLVSNIATTCVDVLRLGTGAIQISLSWNTLTDQDLHVTDPNGELIYYADDTSRSGGQLDRDDTVGYGPENIFWLDNAPDGSYKVSVHDYEYTITRNTFYVTVSGQNESRNFEGTTQYGNTVEVVTFTKSGDRLSF